MILPLVIEPVTFQGLLDLQKNKMGKDVHDLHDKIEIFLLIPIMRIRHILIYHVPFSILASLL